MQDWARLRWLGKDSQQWKVKKQCIKSRPTEWEKTFVSCSSYRRLKARIFQKLKKKKSQTAQSTNGLMKLTNSSQKRKYKCPLNMKRNKKVYFIGHQRNVHQNCIEIPSSPGRMAVKKTDNKCWLRDEGTPNPCWEEGGLVQPREDWVWCFLSTNPPSLWFSCVSSARLLRGFLLQNQTGIARYFWSCKRSTFWSFGLGLELSDRTLV